MADQQDASEHPVGVAGAESDAGAAGESAGTAPQVADPPASGGSAGSDPAPGVVDGGAPASGVEATETGLTPPTAEPEDASGRASDTAALEADQAAGRAATTSVPESRPVGLPDFNARQAAPAVEEHGISMIQDVDLRVKIELGRTRMLVEDVLALGSGSVVELDKLAGDPVDVFVNDRLVARGEVLVLNDNFCVRVSEIVSPADARQVG